MIYNVNVIKNKKGNENSSIYYILMKNNSRKISVSISNDTKSLFNMLKRYEEDVKVKSIIHYETYKYYQKIYFLLNYPAILLSFIINSALFSRLVKTDEKDEENNNNISVNAFLFGNIITIFCNIIIGCVSYFRLDDRMNNHYHYSKEYTRIYRIICQFYYENLVLKEKLQKQILYHFIQNIQSHIFLLFDDEPKCPSNIVHNVKIKNVDICFYVYASKRLKNPYTYENVLKLYQLPTNILLSIMNEVETNPQIHMKYPGFYRFNITKQIPKKDILNFILLEKNISYNDILYINHNLKNDDNLKVIHNIDNEYDKIYIQEQPIIIINNMEVDEVVDTSTTTSTNSDSKPNTPVRNDTIKNNITKIHCNEIHLIRSSSEPILSFDNIIDSEYSNSLIETNDIIQWTITKEDNIVLDTNDTNNDIEMELMEMGLRRHNILSL